MNILYHLDTGAQTVEVACIDVNKLGFSDFVHSFVLRNNGVSVVLKLSLDQYAYYAHEVKRLKAYRHLDERLP